MHKNLLGNHFMTALSLKDFGHFFFVKRKTDQALNYYKEAIEVIGKLGTRNQKERILLLKNYGSCHEKEGNFEEAETLLLEANLVCDSEIEGDHKWKVSVKTELALLYYETARSKETERDKKEELRSKMEKLMKEGLDMCYRLNDNKKSINRLANKKRIVQVLKSYPQRFEKESYYPDESL